MRGAVWLTGACVALALGCAPTRIASDVPLRDRPVQLPGPEVSKDLAAFLGRWVGVWTDGRNYRKNMALIIDRLIPPDRAIGSYGCGTDPRPPSFCPIVIQVSGRLEGGTLRISMSEGEMRYRVNGRFLEGELVDPNNRQVLIRVTATRLP